MLLCDKFFLESNQLPQSASHFAKECKIRLQFNANNVPDKHITRGNSSLPIRAHKTASFQQLDEAVVLF